MLKKGLYYILENWVFNRLIQVEVMDELWVLSFKVQPPVIRFALVLVTNYYFQFAYDLSVVDDLVFLASEAAFIQFVDFLLFLSKIFRLFWLQSSFDHEIVVLNF